MKSLLPGIAATLAALALLACRENPPPPAAIPEEEDRPVQSEVDFSGWNGLGDEARAYLWEAEGIAFQVEHKILPLWLNAFQTRAADGVAHHLAEHAALSIPSGPWELLDGHPLVEESILSGEVEEVSMGGLLQLPERLFGGDPSGARLKLKLEVLRQPGERGPEAPWHAEIRMVLRKDAVEAEATLDCQFGPISRDVSSEAGWLRSVTVRDFRRREGRNDRPLFEDVTAETGLPVAELHDNWRDEPRHLGGTGGFFVEDYDGDGQLDLLLTDAKAGLRLFRGAGGFRFVETTEQSGLGALFAGELPGKAAWADLDGDGDPDLVIAHRLFENAGAGGFLERTFGSGLDMGNYASISVADFDNDGRLDLFVSSSRDLPRSVPEAVNPAWIDGGWGVPNQLWRNLGDWRFDEVAESRGIAGEGGSTFAVTCLDLEGDGDVDVFEINEFGRNHLYRNDGGGRFTDLGDPDPVFGGMSMGVTSGDVDNDGFPEVLVANMHSKAGTRAVGNLLPEWYPPGVHAKLAESTLGSQLYLNRGGKLSVAPVGTLDRRLGWGYGNRFLDIDGDGFLDLYATAGFASIARGKPDG